ncbi:hypothetical protein [Luteolibacter sp. LG18]|uniref:hypothetical protein n=1 Tax=Luteolibacter sp. LG18 TaxID=2819286 RepID=UPI002B2A6DB6|nr:hypothetical protein llg_15600 [Luteolibacter sp. LG18]
MLHILGDMASPRSNKPSGFPEFAVRRETISGYFHPPLPRSTFHDFVKKGKIVPFKDLRGFYKLNDSLRRLGLREVASLPVEVPKRSMEDILRLAFSLIDPLLFPEPPWLSAVDALDVREIDHATLQARLHFEQLSEFTTAEEKLAYFNGILHAQVMLEASASRDGMND